MLLGAMRSSARCLGRVWPWLMVTSAGGTLYLSDLRAGESWVMELGRNPGVRGWRMMRGEGVSDADFVPQMEG